MFSEVQLIFLAFTQVVTPAQGFEVWDCGDTVQIRRDHEVPRSFPVMFYKDAEGVAYYAVKWDAIFSDGGESCALVLSPEARQ